MLSDRLGAEDRVLDAVSFRIPAGAVTVLFGPANSGARVALEVLAGQHSVASGSISVAGADGSPTGGKPTRVAFVSCAPQVFSSLSVSSNLRYMARLGGCRGSQVGRRVEDAAERMLLREFMAVRARDLSDANIRRLHLAMGLVIDPQLMLLDATGLEADQALTDQFVEVLGELAARGAAVAVFTSDVDLACMVADRLVVMRSGRVVAEGPSAAITTAYSRREAAVRLDPLRGDGRSGTNPAGSGGQTRLVRIPLRDHATIQEVLSGMSPEAQSSAVSISLARGSLSKVLSDLTEDRVPGEQCHGGIR